MKTNGAIASDGRNRTERITLCICAQGTEENTKHQSIQLFAYMAERRKETLFPDNSVPFFVGKLKSSQY